MKRYHDLYSARQLIFCDSIAFCDANTHTITFILTSSAIDLSLAVTITGGQSELDYFTEFSLLSKKVQNFGQTFPKYVITLITDDSQTEIQP